METLAKARAVENEAKKKLQIALLKEVKLKQATAGLEVINKQIEHRQLVLEECNNERKKKRNLQRYYNQVSSNTSSYDVTRLIGVVEGALVHLEGRYNTTKAKLLMEAITSGKLFNGAAAHLLKEKIEGHIRQLFCSWKLVKAADVSAVSACKSSTINALQSVSFFVNFEKAFCLLLKAFELDDLATRTSVKVALLVDGANLFRCRTHVSTGIKITDECSVHPVTKQPFSAVDEDLDETYFVKVQSAEDSCVMIIADSFDWKRWWL